MDIEILKKANNSLKEIRELEKRIEILENAYCNAIQGFDYISDKEKGERIGWNLDGELRVIVIEYYKTQLKLLKKNFEKL